MNNLIKINNDTKVTYTQRDSYYYDVTISGNIKGKTFGYTMNGANKNSGGITSDWGKGTYGVRNKVNCEVVNGFMYQYNNSDNGFTAYLGGVKFTSNYASLTFSMGTSYVFSAYVLTFIKN